MSSPSNTTRSTSKDKGSTSPITHITGDELKQVYLKYFGTLFQFQAIYYQTDPHVREFKALKQKQNEADSTPSSSSSTTTTTTTTNTNTTTTPKTRKPLPYTPTHKTPSNNTPSLHTNDEHVSPAIPSGKKRLFEKQGKPQTNSVKKSKVNPLNNDDGNDDNNNNNDKEYVIVNDDSPRSGSNKSQPKDKGKAQTGRMLWESEEENEDLVIHKESEDQPIYSGTKKNFSKEEADFVFKGVRKYGNQWSMILHDSRYSFHECRRPLDLKDKWRNMIKRDPSLKQRALFGRDTESEEDDE